MSHRRWNFRGMRNVVVHEYFGVNNLILWKTVTNNLPDLLSELEELKKMMKEED